MKIFLSYATADQPTVQKIASQLRQAGFDVWEPSTSIFPGDNWALAHGHALESADAIVVFVPRSPSTNVGYEVGYALATRKFEGRIIPVRMSNTGDLPWAIRLNRVIDGSGESASDVARRIAIELRAIKGVRAAPTGRASLKAKPKNKASIVARRRVKLAARNPA